MADYEVFARYAQDRYESARTMLSEFRNWARQLALKVAGAIGVVITMSALLLTLLARQSSIGLVSVTLVVLWGVVILAFLARLLTLYKGAVELGYDIVPFAAPRPPDQLRREWARRQDKNDRALFELIGAEYERARRQRISEGHLVAQSLQGVRDRFVTALTAGLFVTILLAVAITCTVTGGVP